LGSSESFLVRGSDLKATLPIFLLVSPQSSSQNFLCFKGLV
jgi:hypothetical protein